MGFNPQPVQDFIGQGLAFPLQLLNGAAQVSSGFDLIRSSIKNILAFSVGDRFFLGEFGSRLDELLEEPNDEILQNLITSFVIDAVTQWEKRVQSVSTTIDSVTDAAVMVEVSYQIVNTQNSDSFVYPFYRQITT